MRWLKSSRSLGSWRFAIACVLSMVAVVALMLQTARPAGASALCGAVGGGVSGSSDTDATSYVTGSLSATPGKVYLAAVTDTHGSAAPLPTMSGASLTWTEHYTTTFNGAQSRLTVFRALSTGTSGGALTVSTGATTATSFHVHVIECSGTETGGTNGSAAIVQSANNSGTAATSGALTFGAASDAGNVVLGFMAHRQSGQVTPPASWSEQWDSSGSSPGFDLETANRDLTSLTTGTWTWSTSSDWAGYMVEVATEASPPPTTTTTSTTTTTTVGGEVTLNTEESDGVGMFFAVCAFAAGCVAGNAVVRR